MWLKRPQKLPMLSKEERAEKKPEAQREVQLLWKRRAFKQVVEQPENVHLRPGWYKPPEEYANSAVKQSNNGDIFFRAAAFDCGGSRSTK